jgi:hypothetical protein
MPILIILRDYFQFQAFSTASVWLPAELTRVTTSILGHSQTDDWDVINFSVLGIHENIGAV